MWHKYYLQKIRNEILIGKKVEQVIDEKKLIEDFKNTFSDSVLNQTFGFGKYTLLEAVEEMIERQPKTDWIPFEEKEADEDEKEAYGCEYMLCCKLPDEDEEILVTYVNGNVGEDIFLRDGYECYLDSGAEFITEAIAWMPKPQPYKKEGAE